MKWRLLGNMCQMTTFIAVVVLFINVLHPVHYHVFIIQASFYTDRKRYANFQLQDQRNAMVYNR